MSDDLILSQNVPEILSIQSLGSFEKMARDHKQSTQKHKYTADRSAHFV